MSPYYISKLFQNNTIDVVQSFLFQLDRGLADINNDGKMDKKEFSIAMHLIKKKLQGYELPKSLPASLKADPTPVMGSFAPPVMGGTMPPQMNMGFPMGGKSFEK